MNPESLEDQHLDNLHVLYSEDDEVAKELPKTARVACAPKLSNALESHLKQSLAHGSRLEEIFRNLASAEENPSQAIKAGAEDTAHFSSGGDLA